MRSFLTGLVLALVAVGGVAAYLLMQPPATKEAQLAKRPLWTEMTYQEVAGPKEQQFIVSCKATLKPDSGDGRARMAFSMQDRDNYYFVDLAGTGISLGRVENGFEVPIGTRGAAGLTPGSAHEIIIKRHSAPIAVALDGAVVATAYDDTFAAGNLAFGSVANQVAFSDLKVQPIGEVYRSDDFMRNEGDQTLWETVTGNWQVNAINNPTMSTNAFYYIGSGPSEAAVTWGFWFWDNYSFRVAAKPLGDKAVGIYVYYRDKDNYYLLKWSATSQAGKLQLLRRVKGVDTVLAEKPGGYTPNQWYVLGCEVSASRIRGYVDDQLMFEARDSSLCLGKVGLYVDSLQGAQFDDALVKSARSFSEDFREFAPGKWTEMGGAWQVVSDGGRSRFVGTVPSGSAKAVSGESRWSDYAFSADLGPCSRGKAGLCFYYQDELNYYAMLWAAGPEAKRQLVKVVDGKRSIIAQDIPPALSQPRHVSIRLDKGRIFAACDGSPVFEEFDNSLTEGKIGLLAEDTPEASFSNVNVEFVPEKQPLMTVHEVFSRERTMEEWAGEQSDWAPRTDVLAGVTFETNWHRADFPGDVDIEMKAPAEFPANAQLKLMISSNEESLDAGYMFTLAHGSGYKATLSRRGVPVGTADIDEKGGFDHLLFRRIGNYVIAFLGDRAVLSYRDREPVSGVKVGWSAAGVPIRKQDIEVYCDHVHNYSFKEAASDWRIASGIWEVTNRWQCDPRWSFFSGRSQRLAAIWNKREMVGDVTLEFYAAIKMDAERGRRYEYASDMNCTISADGTDLTSGYNFMFGGWRDQRSAIMRGDKILVESASKVIPREDNIHRRWFYLKARKHGNKLSFYVDSNLILEYNDPQPLTGKRAAIWTYNNGLMVSRVRLSCTDGDKKESPLTPQPSQCKSPYDLVTAQSPTPGAPK